jgi:AhpD family alkylhydroperoxidase
MTRQQIYQEIEKGMGVVPGFFQALPDKTLEAEWQLFKLTQVEEGPIPNKYRELIGVAISAATKCRFCTYFHTEMAKVAGATAAEIEEAVHYAKATQGWSTYVNGLGYDFEQFKREVTTAVNYIRSNR